MQNHASDPEVRRGGIGSSDVAVILGLSKWKTPYELWMEKRGLSAPVDDTPYLRRGRLMEPIARDEYEGICGYDPEDILSGGYIDRRGTYPWFHGHPDLIVAVQGCRGFPTELKTAERGTFHKAVNDGLSMHYLAQLVYEMYLCAADHAELFMLNPDSWQSHIFKIDRDETTDKLWADIVAACNSFWSHVLDGTPPPEPEQPKNLPAPTGGKVQQVSDEIWMKAGADLAVAQEIAEQANELLARSKDQIHRIMEANGWQIAEGPIALPEGTRTLRYHYREVKGRTTIQGKDLLAWVGRLKQEVETELDAAPFVLEALRKIDLACFQKIGDPHMSGVPYWITKRAEIEGGPQAGGLIE